MTKSSEHNLPSTIELERSVQLFKAFGDQTRYKILSLLSNKNLTVNEIADEIGITQSAISHQLKLLRQTGLVKGIRDGQKINYELSDQHIITIFEQVREHVREGNL
ncbi:metalloregulator ArsR/SmtB family transcription factor [Liquorilactobacillus mali]|uniref:ArsR family transcriptional regulator n=1 Tax=Liquorilactobacillus mali TaxID=1618 RepID=A0A0R2G478_9LACO|nr:metalloregulator ArsR/SmtB family transcription factor [Liquorilactobacillus mali]KRN32074.1 ArsR family transcriptional regulator [Liquorilactobacillus mali]MDN7145427.1 metalloregulator ArsR/SmtB family transcription factor [Liquorilactobacillus mali]